MCACKYGMIGSVFLSPLLLCGSAMYLVTAQAAMIKYDLLWTLTK